MRESPFSGLVIRFGQFLQELLAISLRESYFQPDFSFDPTVSESSPFYAREVILKCAVLVLKGFKTRELS